MKNLVIVESPLKAKTIETYLGKDYTVLSCKGHVRDLANSGKGGLGIDIEDNFKPTYVVLKDKNSLVNTLKKEAKDKNVILATDPDREGEAIAWHLAKVLDLDLENQNRVAFQEITKEAILANISNLRKIDLNLVNSQESRRITDKIIGYKLSYLVKVKQGAKSAGRVQSVALKLICDLEDKINKFIPEKYYDIRIKNSDFEALYIKPDKELIKEDKKDIIEKEAQPNYLVKEINKRESISKPKLAYTTSTMQQDAVNKISFNSSKTMKIAQELYEGVEIDGKMQGLITYMRTDSTRLSESFINSVNGFVKENYGNEYVGLYVSKNNKNSQDAHEAVRPTYVANTPESIEKYLTKDQFKLYKLIYNRAVSSLMANAINEIEEVIFEKNNHLFKLEGVKNKFLGYQILDEKTKNKKIPKFKQGQEIEAILEINEKFTLPPARYTEASLIKELEQNGIGRPSTYAAIISTLKQRDYASVSKKQFYPSQLGIKINTKLQEFFNTFINEEYTSNLEKQLDEIALGNIEKLIYLNKFYNEFTPLLDNAFKNMDVEKHKVMTGKPCPKCGNELIERKSKFGYFNGCSGFPKCRYVESVENKEENK